MNEGQRLYAQMNCVGCHAHGGGGMGPALMDGRWIYGFDDASTFESIVNGRPNGMPAFRPRLSDDQAWQLVAYVKSLGGNASKAVAAVRDDHMALTPGPARVDPQPIIVGSKP
jgi:cytochrome c oxidase cbb3-type subunit 3